jgi:hypothetical protein
MRRVKMPKFMVYESANAVFTYLIEADSKDEAYKIVDEGFSDPIRVEYIEREIYDIVESEDE